ncbi:MAG TPA: hypothetical protein VJ892_00370 [Candidatus Absconditabacterales bacterium]|nr:hypothetical protein [Candidatus Absconditabacterales bacterium]
MNNYFFYLHLGCSVGSSTMSFVIASEEEITKAPVKETLDLLQKVCNNTKKTYLFNDRIGDILFYLKEGWINDFSLKAVMEWDKNEKKLLGSICDEKIKVYYYV